MIQSLKLDEFLELPEATRRRILNDPGDFSELCNVQNRKHVVVQRIGSAQLLKSAVRKARKTSGMTVVSEGWPSIDRTRCTGHVEHHAEAVPGLHEPDDERKHRLARDVASIALVEVEALAGHPAASQTLRHATSAGEDVQQERSKSVLPNLQPRRFRRTRRNMAPSKSSAFRLAVARCCKVRLVYTS